jgi:acetylornithine deacetylase/succinyl-diaminopimelate desuccinylase-like protein
MYKQTGSLSATHKSEIDGLLLDLRSLIRVPSISAKHQRLEECAKVVVNIMRRANIYSELLYMDKTRRDSVPPLVYGEIKSRSNPNGRTILFYNHYDVQPIEPIDRWKRHPFGAEIVGNKIFGRGSADDKGELIARIKAVESIIRATGDVPCNIKFIIEGEEEIGSPNLRNYLKLLGHRLKCDAIIWEFGYIDTKLRPIINLGMKGILYVELNVIGPLTDMHSSLAAIVSNPAWIMVKALSTLWDEKSGIITVKDWYKEFRSLTAQELFFSATQPAFDEVEFKKKYKLDHLSSWLNRSELRRALAERPTCNISGISSGHDGKAAKTVLPATARALIDFRLVPEMNPKVQFNRLRTHLLKAGFGNISVKLVHALAPSRTKFTNPFVNIVANSATVTFGSKPIINLSSAGSGPMSLLVELTRAPCIAIGCSDIFSNIHSFNEFARIDLLRMGKKLISEVICRFAYTQGARTTF